jgi:hypothetical protein
LLFLQLAGFISFLHIISINRKVFTSYPRFYESV